MPYALMLIRSREAVLKHQLSACYWRLRVSMPYALFERANAPKDMAAFVTESAEFQTPIKGCKYGSATEGKAEQGPKFFTHCKRRTAKTAAVSR